jgi:D-glycero-D-manno-heptose 1,7-bisphosphate phosphatase
MKRAVFLDRDGTILEHVAYMTDPAQVRIAPGSAEALRKLSAAGYLLVVVSNQSLVARGLGTREQAEAVSRRMEELFAAEGVRFDAIKYSFDAPGSNAPRRKPNTGMLLEAADELGIDLPRSAMIGDDPRDIEAGRAAGCRVNVLISETPVPGEKTARGIGDAVELVLKSN